MCLELVRGKSPARTAPVSPSLRSIDRVNYKVVEQQDELLEFVEAVADAPLIGFDTEFVAEDCYQPDLCLLQISTRERVAIVDPKGCDDLHELWGLLTDPNRQVMVHSGREEILFVYRATGQAIPRLFDVQVAVGLLGGEYPISYGKLLQRYLGKNVPKGETRTDWRKRPLSKAQLDYAALDVVHLPELYDLLTDELHKAGRLDWLDDELKHRQANLLKTQEQEGWERMSGIQSLTTRQLTILRELWRWRDARAQHKNMPARRVLRDDLIIELARRETSNPKKIAHIRGLHHAGIQRFLPEIGECIARGLSADEIRSPWNMRNRRSRPPALLQQYLSAAMSYLCRSNSISPAIVGTSDDVGKLASYWLQGNGEDGDELPQLLKGWRGEFVGKPLYDVFRGKKALRVLDPTQEMPLGICEVERETGEDD